jgi:predicted nucleic acid-binding protein
MDPLLSAFVIYHKVLNETIARLRRESSLIDSVIDEIAEVRRVYNY